MRKHRDVAGDRSDARYFSIDSRANLVGAFTAGTAMREQHPAGCERANLLLGQSLVRAVVPLDEAGIDLGTVAEACEFAGLSGPR